MISKQYRVRNCLQGCEHLVYQVRGLAALCALSAVPGTRHHLTVVCGCDRRTSHLPCERDSWPLTRAPLRAESREKNSSVACLEHRRRKGPALARFVAKVRGREPAHATHFTQHTDFKFDFVFFRSRGEAWPHGTTRDKSNRKDEIRQGCRVI